MESFKDRLLYVMQQKDLRQADLVERTGINKSTISYYCTGRNLPNAENIRKLAIALNVREDWLLGYDSTMERTGISSEEANEIIRTIRSLSPENQELLFSFLRVLQHQDTSKT